MKLEEVPVIGPRTLLPDSLDEPYWEALDNGILKLQHCPACDNWIWAPRFVCPHCHRPHPDWAEVEPVGTIFSWTRTWHPFGAEFVDHLPYLSVLVELPGAGGRRLLGVLLGDQGADPRIGEPVRGVIQPASELTGGASVLRWERASQG